MRNNTRATSFTDSQDDTDTATMIICPNDWMVSEETLSDMISVFGDPQKENRQMALDENKDPLVKAERRQLRLQPAWIPCGHDHAPKIIRPRARANL